MTSETPKTSQTAVPQRNDLETRTPVPQTMVPTNNEATQTARRSKRLRLRYWVDPSLQLPYVIGSVVLGVTLSTTLGIYLFSMFWDVAMEDLAWKTGSMVPMEIYGQVRNTFFLGTVAAGGVITVLCALCTVVVTHRLAGPLFNIRRTVRTWLGGNTEPRIRLRKSDELMDFADDLNRLTEGLQTELRRRDAVLRETSEILKQRAEPWADQLAARLDSQRSA
jgi:hypothetical protein